MSLLFRSQVLHRVQSLLKQLRAAPSTEACPERLHTTANHHKCDAVQGTALAEGSWAGFAATSAQPAEEAFHVFVIDDNMFYRRWPSDTHPSHF